MEDKLIFQVMLEAHDQIIPNCAEPILTLSHFLNNTGVEVRIEMPAFHIAHVAPLDGHSEADRNREPSVVVCWVCEGLLLV